MKRLLAFSLIAILAVLASCAGMQPVSEKDLIIQRIIEVPDFTKDQIYNQTKIWIAENFRSAKAVIEHDDKESGTLIGNGIIKYPCEGLELLAKDDWKVHFTMRVDIKDGKFRQTFSNLRISWPARRDSLGYHKAYEGPVATQGDLNKIKPKLLKMGDQIANAIKKSKGETKW